MIKTHLAKQFNANPVLQKRFKEDLQVIFSLSQDKRSAILNEYLQFSSKFYNPQGSFSLTKLGEKYSEDPVCIHTFLNLSAFFAEAILENLDDSIDEIAKDIFDLQIITHENIVDFKKFLENIKDKAQEINSSTKRQKEQVGILPFYTSIDTTVELRTLLETEYDCGEKIEEFSPKISELIPVITCRVRVDSGLQREFFFQTSIDSLTELIDCLIAAKKTALAVLKTISED
jgi:hypothetical protein